MRCICVGGMDMDLIEDIVWVARRGMVYSKGSINGVSENMYSICNSETAYILAHVEGAANRRYNST